MDVGSEAAVVSEIVARVVRILVDGDRVAVPDPVRYIGPIDRGHFKVVAVEPESLLISALDMEYVTRSEPEAKLTVGKWAIDVRNVLMLDPLFAFDVRTGSRDRAAVRGSAANLWGSAVSFRRAALGLAAASFGPGALRRSAVGFGPWLRRAARRTTLRIMLLLSTSLSLFLVTALVRI